MNVVGYPSTRKNDLVVKNLNGEMLIYDLETNRASCLNETSALIWNLCDGNTSIDEIRNELSSILGSPVEEDLIWLALDQFNNANLIEATEEINEHFNTVSRRDVIRKVGFVSIVALPIISSVVSPPALSAQSGCLQADVACDITNDMCCPGLTCRNVFGPNFFFCRP